MTLEHSLVMERAIGRMFDNQRRSDQDRYEQRLSYAERCARAEAELADEFMELVRGGKLDAVAEFEKPRLDYSKRTDAGVPTRPSTLFDVLREIVEYEDFDRQLFDLLIRSANGSHVSEDARELVEKMAAKHANMTVEVE